MRGEVLVGDRPWLPYPSGWFCVGFSRELPAGKVLTRRFMGEDVVVYRTRAGAVRAVRPYCPHLGAHLGVGGSVEGELLVCPFHRFAFDPEGACAKVPVGKPPRARLDHYPIREQHGIIYLWHGEGEPKWELPEIDDTGFGPTVSWSKEMATHPQEVMENGFDYTHLKELHGMDVRKTGSLEVEGPYLRLHLQVCVATLPVLGDIVVDQPSQLAGLGQGMTEILLNNNGPTVRLWLLPTPIDPWQIRLSVATACELRSPQWLSAPLRRTVSGAMSQAVAYVLLQRIAGVIGEDESIWNHKKYEPHPRLGPQGKAIGQYRRWARQFYPLHPEMPEAPVDGSRPTPTHGPVPEESKARQ
jgi:cholesterol 7-dehydrogenase